MKVGIQKVEKMTSEKAGDYLKISYLTDTGKEGFKNIFKDLKDKWPLLEEGAEVELTTEKKGQFWNVVDIAPLGEKSESKPAKPQSKPEGRNKSFALSYSKDLFTAIIQAGGLKDSTVSQIVTLIITQAKEFEKYLDGE